MAKVLLVRGKDTGFLEHTIVEALSGMAVETLPVNVADEYLYERADDADVFLLMGGQIEDERMFVFNTLRDKCFDQSKRVLLYGNPSETEKMNKYFPSAVVGDYLLRPIDASEVAKSTVRQIQLRKRRLNRPKLLCVSVDTNIRERVREWLEPEYVVRGIEEFSEAVQAVSTDEPALILVDYTSNYKGGRLYDEIKASKERLNGVPFVCINVKNDIDSKQEFMVLKPKGFLAESAGKQELKAKMAELLEI